MPQRFNATTYRVSAREAVALAAAEWDYEQHTKTTRKRYEDDPIGFITERLGEELWSKQREIAEAVQKYPKVAVQSCQGPGKSFLAARLVAWWLSEKRDPFAVTTAPTGRQVKVILWKEIGRAHAKGHLEGRLNQTEWWVTVDEREEIIGFGIKPADYDPAAFQGVHAGSVLVVIDEAGGVPEAIFIGADTVTTGENDRQLAIGNPDDPSSYFAKICRPGSGWHVIRIDGLETPNFTKEKVSPALRASLVSRSWVEEKRTTWGEGSPLWQSKVRGLFPEDASDGVVPLSWAVRCQQTDRDYTPDQLAPVELGVDVGAGGDYTVVRERRGIKAGRSWRKRTPEPAEAAGMVMVAIRETGATKVKVDSIGVGWGIAGRLRELGEEGAHHAHIVSVNVGAASRDPRRFPRLRDQLWWEIGRELSQTGGWDLSAVEDDTIAQLIEPKYALDSSGRTKVEPKDETIKRLGHSPDDADALLLAFYEGGLAWGAV